MQSIWQNTNLLKLNSIRLTLRGFLPLCQHLAICIICLQNKTTPNKYFGKELTRKN